MPRTRSRALAAAVVATSVAALGLVVAPAATADSSVPPPWLRPLQTPPTVVRPADLQGACPAVVAYVSRGSIENADGSNGDNWQSQDYVGRSKYYNGVGEEMSVLVNRLKELYGTRLKVVANVKENYPAASWNLDSDQPFVPTVVNSVRSGAVGAIRDLKAIRTACPNAKIAVIGYSQGAHVTRLALGTNSSVRIAGEYLDFTPGAGQAVALTFGDSAWNRRAAVFGQAAYVGDTYRPGAASARDEEGAAEWVYTGPFLAAVPVADRPMVRPAPTPSAWNLTTYCHGQDPACQAAHQKPQVALGLTAHLTYDRDDAIGAANRVATMFASVGAQPVTPSVRLDGTGPGTSGRACLPHGATMSRQATLAGGADGSRLITQTWTPGSAFVGGTVTPATSTVAKPGPDKTLGVQAASGPIYNDVWTVTAQHTFAVEGSIVPETRDVILYQARLCPTDLNYDTSAY